jgi:hypothetical protein
VSERPAARLSLQPQHARALVGSLAIGAAVVMAPLMPRIAGYAEQRTTFAAVAAAILAAAGVLLATVAAATSRR